VKVYVKLTKRDKEGKNVANLDRFFSLTKDATRKFYTIDQDADEENANLFNVKAVAITRAVTVICEGTLYADELFIDINTLEDVFARNGFTYVDKIVED